MFAGRNGLSGAQKAMQSTAVLPRGIPEIDPSSCVPGKAVEGFKKASRSSGNSRIQGSATLNPEAKSACHCWMRQDWTAIWQTVSSVLVPGSVVQSSRSHEFHTGKRHACLKPFPRAKWKVLKTRSLIVWKTKGD